MRRTLIAVAIGTALLAGIAPATEAGQPIYGSQLMTQQERLDHRARMRAAASAEEREQIRADHHERMQERARAHGITLPDEPPARGAGMGPRGMGPGPGRNR